MPGEVVCLVETGIASQFEEDKLDKATFSVSARVSLSVETIGQSVT